MPGTKVKALVKRTWIYAEAPAVYGIECDLCGGTHIEWSEFVGHVWCLDCQKDTPGTPGVFGGPIGINVSRLLGMTFDRIDLATGKRTKFDDYMGKGGEVGVRLELDAAGTVLLSSEGLQCTVAEARIGEVLIVLLGAAGPLAAKAASRLKTYGNTEIFADREAWTQCVNREGKFQ